MSAAELYGERKLRGGFGQYKEVLAGFIVKTNTDFAQLNRSEQG